MKHDVLRQVQYIQHALAQNKRHTGFFIGAGCPLSVQIEIDEPVEAGADSSGTVTATPDAVLVPAVMKKKTVPLIPDVAGLSKVISDTLSGGEDKESTWDKVITIVKEDEGDASNIEFVLSRIRQLKSVAGKKDVRGLSRTELTALDHEICGIISKLVNKQLPDTHTPYHNLAIWARSIRRDNPVHVFTTNYDLLLEQAFEESSTPYFDGFVGSRRAFFDLGAVEDEKILPSRWARLWKIHGSLNWRLNADEKTVVRSDEVDSKLSYLIYPSHLKYDQSRKMPYLAMLDRLKDFLLKPNSILFMSGYSFGDEHINDVLCRTLEANPTAHVFAFLYGKLNQEKYKQAVKCGTSTPNLSVLAFDKGIIGRLEGEWKPVGEEKPFSLPAGVIVSLSDDENELRLGDFAQFGQLIKYLTGERTDDDI